MSGAASWMSDAGARARAASRILAGTSAEARNAGLRAAAARLRAQAAAILAANREDVAGAAGNDAFRDRLLLNPERVEAMARGLDDIAALPDPLARTLADWTRPNGLRIRRVAAPVGVIGMIYESRPNVTIEAASLAIKSGNAAILRGGSEAIDSNRALALLVSGALADAGLPAEAVQLVQEQRPAVVLCDPCSLGGDSGTALQTLCATGCPVVVLTTTLRDGEAATLARSGAAAVLLKGEPLPAVLEAIAGIGASTAGAPVAAAR